MPVLATGMAWAFLRLAVQRRAALSTGAVWLLTGILAVYCVRNLQRARSYFSVTARESVIRDLVGQVERLDLSPESPFVLGFLTDSGDLYNIQGLRRILLAERPTRESGEGPAGTAGRAPEPGTRGPAIAYVDRTSWNPEIAALPAGYRVEAFAHVGSNPIALVRLSRKGLAQP